MVAASRNIPLFMMVLIVLSRASEGSLQSVSAGDVVCVVKAFQPYIYGGNVDSSNMGIRSELYIYNGSTPPCAIVRFFDTYSKITPDGLSPSGQILMHLPYQAFRDTIDYLKSTATSVTLTSKATNAVILPAGKAKIEAPLE